MSRGTVVTPPPEPEAPHVEIVEARGLRWINIERPRPVDRAWLEEHFDFHPLDYEDVFSRNQRPKIDEYDDYLFIVLYFPRFDKQVGRLNAAELDLFVGPDFLITLPNEPLQPVEYLFERCRTDEELREQWFSKGAGYLLYKIVDDVRGRVVPDAAQDGQQARAHRGRDLRGQLSRRSCATSPTSSRRSSTSARSSARSAPSSATSSAPSRATSPTTSTSTSTTSTTPPSASGSMLESYKETVEALEVDERVGPLAPLNDVLRVLTVLSVVFLPLTLIASIFGMNVRVPRARARRRPVFWIIIAAMVVMLGGMIAYFRRRGWL